MVVSVVEKSFCLQVAARSAYLDILPWLASSSPDSWGTVSFTRWTLELSHMTMSGLSSVAATEGGRRSCSQGDQTRCSFLGGGGRKERRRWNQGPRRASCCTSSAARPQGSCSAHGGVTGPSRTGGMMRLVSSATCTGSGCGVVCPWWR